MLQLELHARRQEGGALQQPRDHRVHAVADQPAEPLGDARILLGEFARLLVQQLEFPIVEIEEFPVHRSYSRLIAILPLSSSTSATNSTGTLTRLAEQVGAAR